MISILCFFRVETCWKPPSNAGSDSTGRRHTQDGLVRSSEVKGNHLQQIRVYKSNIIHKEIPWKSGFGVIFIDIV